MSGWHCRNVADAFSAGKCEGPRHATCGVRYPPGEYTLTAEGLALPGIGTVRLEGAAPAPKGLPVIVYEDDGGWTAEFLDEAALCSPAAAGWAATSTASPGTPGLTPSTSGRSPGG